VVWVREQVLAPDLALANATDRVTIELAIIDGLTMQNRFFRTADGVLIVSPKKTALPLSGAWEADMTPSTLATPGGSAYRRTVNGPDYAYLDYFAVPTAQKTPLAITAASRTGTLVTLTAASTTGYAIGDRIVVPPLTLAGYEGQWTITNVTGTTIQYNTTASGTLGTATGTIGKMWSLYELLTVAPQTPPSYPLSNEIDTAEITANVSGIGAFNGINILPVTGLVVDTLNVSYPQYIDLMLWMEHAATANANLITCIAAVGSTVIGQQIAAAAGFVGAAGKETSPFASARIPPNTAAGSYQAFVYTDTVGNVNVIASGSSPCRMVVRGA